MFVKYPTSNLQKLSESKSGFTIIEVLVVSAILAVLVTISVQSFFSIQKKTDVDGAVNEFTAVIKLAQSRTLASENEGQYGVYINTSPTPHQYIMFKGTSYTLRDPAYDTVYPLPKTVEFFGISLGGGNEIVFSKLTGESGVSGTVSLRNKADTTQSKTVYVTNSGVINFASTTPSDTARVKDSRHVHFDYSRVINTTTESITLLFDGIVSQVIPIVSNMSGGQIYWSGTVSAGGLNQTITIKTHRLNSADTQFSIHRDGRYNNKSLRVTISGDSFGYLANYSADGLTTGYTSTYVSNFAWQ